MTLELSQWLFIIGLPSNVYLLIEWSSEVFGLWWHERFTAHNVVRSPLSSLANFMLNNSCIFYSLCVSLVIDIIWGVLFHWLNCLFIFCGLYVIWWYACDVAANWKIISCESFCFNMWHVLQVTKLCDLGIDDSVCSVGWAPLGTYLSVGSNSGKVQVRVHVPNLSLAIVTTVSYLLSVIFGFSSFMTP